MEKPRYLVMVTSENNNKFYKQIPVDDNTWIAEYGRIGSTSTRRSYPMSSWNSKYNEKIRKGYEDKSDLIEEMIVEIKKDEVEYNEIENRAIAEIVERLQSMARKAISANYTVSSDSVTQAMVDEAQNMLIELTKDMSVTKFNNLLLKLFSTIPRKMTEVSKYLAKSKSDFAEIISREQNLLDVMRGQVVQNKQKKTEVENHIEKKDETILEHLGLVFEECDSEDIAKIQMALGESVGKFSRAWKVTNIETQKRYDEFVKKEKIRKKKLLFHGSRNENWWSIISTGLVLRPTNAVITGKLYGMGIYFAPKARKSIGYTSLNGSYWASGHSDVAYMALMEVAYGKPYDVHSYDSRFNGMTYETLQKLQAGANCLHAHAGANMGGYSSLRNDEIVIYKEEQCTIKYLVEIKN